MTLRNRASDLLAEVERYESTKDVRESVMAEWGRCLIHDLADVLRESVRTEDRIERAVDAHLASLRGDAV